MYRLNPAPLTILGILKNAWELYKTSLKYVLPWTFIISLIHVIPYSFNFVGFYQRKTVNHIEFSMLALLLFVVLLFFEAFFVSFVFYSMYSLATEQKANFFQSLRLASSRFIYLYLAMLIYHLSVNVGILLFLLPGVFLAIIFSMFSLYILIERESIYNSFEHSVKLVWGYWWQTFFVFLVPYLFAYLAIYVIKFVSLSTYGKWYLAGSIITLTFLLPYFYAELLVQYNNLKIIKSFPRPISKTSRIVRED